LIIFQLQSGFSGTHYRDNPPQASVAYSPDGVMASTVPFPSPNYPAVGDNANGGSIVVSFDNCDTAAQTTNLTFVRIDDRNQVVSTNTFAEDGCISGTGAGAMVDLQNNTLLVRGGGEGFIGRWFDANAQPLTGWFDAGVPDGALWLLRPLIGGGAALRAGDNWIATFESGKAGKNPVPAAFAKSHNLVLAAGGKAYALLPDPGISDSVDVVSASGQSCGSILSTGAISNLFFAGKDGTLITLGGPSNCTATYYSQALK